MVGLVEFGEQLDEVGQGLGVGVGGFVVEDVDVQEGQQGALSKASLAFVSVSRAAAVRKAVPKVL